MSKPRFSPLWNEFDEFGALVGLPRIPGETNKEYRDRLRVNFQYPSNSTYQGLVNGIIKELDGIDTDRPVPIDAHINPNFSVNRSLIDTQTEADIIVNVMDRCGIGKGLVLSKYDPDTSWDDIVLEISNRYPSRLVPALGNFDPYHSDGKDYVTEKLKTRRYRALGEVHINKPPNENFKDICNVAGKVFGVPVYIRCTHESWITGLLEFCVNTNFIWVGGGFTLDNVETRINSIENMLSNYSNLYIDLSVTMDVFGVLMDSANFRSLVKDKPDRFIIGFGIDDGDYRDYNKKWTMYRKFMDLAGLTTEDKEKLMWGNIERLTQTFFGNNASWSEHDYTTRPYKVESKRFYILSESPLYDSDITVTPDNIGDWEVHRIPDPHKTDRQWIFTRIFEFKDTLPPDGMEFMVTYDVMDGSIRTKKTDIFEAVSSISPSSDSIKVHALNDRDYLYSTSNGLMTEEGTATSKMEKLVDRINEIVPVMWGHFVWNDSYWDMGDEGLVTADGRITGLEYLPTIFDPYKCYRLVSASKTEGGSTAECYLTDYFPKDTNPGEEIIIRVVIARVGNSNEDVEFSVYSGKGNDDILVKNIKVENDVVIDGYFKSGVQYSSNTQGVEYVGLRFHFIPPRGENELYNTDDEWIFTIKPMLPKRYYHSGIGDYTDLLIEGIEVKYPPIKSTEEVAGIAGAPESWEKQ